MRQSLRKLSSLTVLVALAAISQIPGTASGNPVTIQPGSNVPAIVNSYPGGTTFSFQPGTYRLLSIQPKDGDMFLGNGRAILSGSQTLTTFSRSGNLYVATGQTQQGQTGGLCDSTHPRCIYPEDLYFDDVPLLQASSLSAVTTGSWYFDYAAHTIYFADNPAGHVVETSITAAAIWGPASNVTVDGFTVEKYASPAGQFAAIGGQSPGANWTITNNEVRLNHSGGINVGTGGIARFNNSHHNGNKGIGCLGNGIVIQGNTLAYNNYAGFSYDWEAGGMKCSMTKDLVVRGNAIHDNNGPGAWSDEYSVNTLYEGNIVMNNTGGAGIQYEISSGATIRNNIVCYNSLPTVAWLWASQIQIQNSQNVEAYQNWVETPITVGGHGISIIQQDRGTGPWGPLTAINNYVHDNTIVYRGGPTSSGMGADWNMADLLANGHNLFDHNAYHLDDPAWYHWGWVNSELFSGMQSLGQELHGTVDSIMPPIHQ